MLARPALLAQPPSASVTATNAPGVGPSGATHTRFRAWKEDLRDAE